jgi:signal transduction histidine kinase
VIRSPRWWSHRSLRLRVTLLSTAVLAVGLILGSFALADLFVQARVNAVDAVVKSEATTVAALATTGDLPSPLPAPAGGTVLAQIIDPAGTVLAATASASRVLSIVAVPATFAPSAHTFTTRTSSLGSAPVRVVTLTSDLKGTPVEIVAALPIADVTSTLEALRRVLFVAVPIVLLAVAAGTWIAVGAALGPVDLLRTEADALEADDRDEPPQLRVPEGADELRRLGATLNRMLSRLHGAGAQQRSFVANAAHELRSPIAAIQTQLEVALATSPGEDEWPVIAADVLADVERLGAIASDLLLLARLDRLSAGQDVGVTDIGKLADPRGTSFFVRGEEISLRRLLDNLISNADRHARSTVQVSVTQSGSTVVVAVEDDGPGIPIADRERVFERWVRLDEGRSRTDGGAGLGLAIARSIARQHGGDVLLSESSLGGLRAEVQLPVDPVTVILQT